MVKSQPERVFLLTNVISNEVNTKKSASVELQSEAPPQVPPRMKKKGPALPEKPPHMRAKPINNPSSQPPREPLRPRALPLSNFDKQPATQREVLVAASKAVREKPVEKRQREPAKLLMPTTGGSNKKELTVIPLKSSANGEDCFPIKHLDQRFEAKNLSTRKSRPPQPILLIPRSLMSWGSAPVSYALWMQRDVAPPKGAPRREPAKNQLQDKLESSATSVRTRSGSVTRSGSLTSQGSSSSESGNETFPKSVLKKQKRNTMASNNSKGGSNRKIEPKKNVTFNAFATVQLMEE